MVEKHNQEPLAEDLIEQVFGQISEDQMLQITPEACRLYAYVETGETVMRGATVGESEYAIRVPVKEPLLQKEVASIADLYEPYEPYEYENGVTGHTIEHPAYAEWLEGLVKPEDIKTAAQVEVDRRSREGDEAVIACGNCSGDMHFELRCSCTFGGTTFIDMTESGEDSTVSLRPDGEPDPECGTCGGTGTHKNDCPMCAGSGVAAKYPQIILKNEATEEERILELNIARLITQDEIDISWVGFENVYSNGEVRSHKTISFDFVRFIGRNITEMGIDYKSAARVTEYGLGNLEANFPRLTSQSAFWDISDGAIHSNINRGEGPMTAAEILDAAQRQISRDRAYPEGKLKDENGIAVAEQWVMRPMKSVTELLDELIAETAAQGYTVGFSHSFIATEERGPSFYLLDADGTPIEQLSLDYYLHEALATALENFRKIAGELPTTE